MSGRAYLIGAGPGDPELLTIKGRRLLAEADVVLYDHLAPDALLDLAPAGAERIYVGKKRADHAVSQEEICALLVDRARRGLTVVRLKGGDPFIFGRGGEEAEALADAGIPFEVVPGVTTPLGIAAYTGVPLTHRDHTSAVTFVTGHAVEAIDWDKVGHVETLVVFMGLTHFAEIARELIARGRNPETPAMAVRWATRPSQETITGTLATLPRLLSERGMKPPATIVVGEVVRLREKLDWYERLPLFGKRIVVTRAKEQSDALASRLRALGADAIEVPAIEIRPAADYGPLDSAIAELEAYDWLIFTSANGVRFFVDRLDRSGRDWRSLRARLCAIGPATRAAIEALHLKVDLMGKEYVAEGLLNAFARVRSRRQARAAAARGGGARRGPGGAAAARRASGCGRGVPDRRAGRRGGADPARARRQAALRDVHEFVDGAEFRGAGGRGAAAGDSRGIDRPDHERDGARAGSGRDGGGARVHDRRAGGGGAADPVGQPIWLGSRAATPDVQSAGAK